MHCFIISALVSVSEEVRSRCHLKHRIAHTISESTSSDSISNELVSHQIHQLATSPMLPPAVSPCQPQPQLPPPPAIIPPPPPVLNNTNNAVMFVSSPPPTSPAASGPPSTPPSGGSVTSGGSSGAGSNNSTSPSPGSAPLAPQSFPGALTPTTRRQKSWDTLDQNAMAQARQQKNTHLTQVQVQSDNPVTMASFFSLLPVSSVCLD